MANDNRPLFPVFRHLQVLLTRQSGQIVAAAPLTLLTVVLAMSLAASVVAEDDTTTGLPAEADEDTQPARDCNMGLVLLEFNTYERSWIRYLNVDSLGEPLLVAAEDLTAYPFRRVNNGSARVRIADLEDPEFLQSLAADHDLMYDEDLVEGMCDVARLRGLSTDVICTPGTEGMETGHVFLVLYHPLNLKVAALTTSIDNTRGGALRDWSLPDRTVAADDDGDPRLCGPFNEGEWINAQSLDPDHGLPISMKDVLWEVTDYQCVISDDGQPYLQAYSIRHDLAGRGNSSFSGCWCEEFNWSGSPCSSILGCCGGDALSWNECDGPHARQSYLDSRPDRLAGMTAEARSRLTRH